MIAVLLFFAALGAVEAQELKPHEGFKGIRWGASVEDMLKVFTNAQPKPADLGAPREKVYFVGSNVGTVHVDLHLFFLDGKFGQALMHFDRQELPRVVEIFKERYGKPAIEGTSMVTWMMQETLVMISPPDGAGVSSREFVNYMEERRRRHLKDAAKDL